MSNHPVVTEELDPEERVKRAKGLRVEAYVFFALAAFFLGAFGVYAVYSSDPAGITALLLTGTMLAMIATFLLFSSRRLADPRPEDDPEAEVADGAGEVGFFSAASYWPFALASATMLTAIGIAFWLVWLMVIGFSFLFLALWGWLSEYQRSHSH